MINFTPINLKKNEMDIVLNINNFPNLIKTKTTNRTQMTSLAISLVTSAKHLRNYNFNLTPNLSEASITFIPKSCKNNIK